MKTYKREIKVIPVAEFSRSGKVEALESGFFSLFISGAPDYEYQNWSRNEISDLRDALTWILDNS